MIRIEGLSKTFTLHLRDGIQLPVLNDFSMTVRAGECVTLSGPSGVGKSTLIRSIYGNYRPQRGHIWLRDGTEMVDIAAADARVILGLRRRTLGYVSQFLRVIPRVGALDVVAEPLRDFGVEPEAARQRAAELLDRLGIPERLWSLPPATFSGGEQQRVNIARVFVASYPILLLDEPTASLDAVNRAIVVELIGEARARGAALVAIMHDEATREAVGTRPIAMTRLEEAAA